MPEFQEEITPIRKDTNGGFIVLEAALVLPILILSLVVLSFVISAISSEENVMHIMTDEARLAMIRGHFISKDPGLPDRIEKRILDEDESVSYSRVGNYWFGHALAGDNSLISFNNKTIAEIKLPIFNKKEIQMDNRVLCRAFVGADPVSGPMSFDDMEKEDDANQVYVFPQYGMRYHTKNCTFVNARPSRMKVASAKRKGYGACRLCRAGKLKMGDSCYCFQAYGDKYHRQTCSTLQRRYVSMEKANAKSRGYLACSKCGPGN